MILAFLDKLIFANSGRARVWTPGPVLLRLCVRWGADGSVLDTGFRAPSRERANRLLHALLPGQRFGQGITYERPGGSKDDVGDSCVLRRLLKFEFGEASAARSQIARGIRGLGGVRWCSCVFMRNPSCSCVAMRD